MSKAKKRIITAIVILVIVAGVGTVFGVTQTSTADSKTVSTITLKQKQLEKSISVTGRISPIESRDITTDAMGKIKEVKVEEHDKVEEGDVLCKTEDKTIKSPIDGTVTKVSAKKGEYPVAGENLFEIKDLSQLQVVANVTEYDVLDIKKNMKATITTDAKEGKEWSGKITDISETTTDDNGNFTVKIKIDKPGKYLKSGMTAKVKLIVKSESNAYAVPYDSITKTSESSGYVYVDNGEDAEKRYEKIQIKTGLETDYYIQISGEGLKDGLKVVSGTDSIKEIAKEDSEKK